jgi:predicted DNA-binding transcriptional regulator AlpA
MFATEDQLLRTPQAAARLGLNSKTLAQWRWRGCGPKFYRIGDGRHAAIRYRPSDLEAYIASRVATSTSDPGQAVAR